MYHVQTVDDYSCNVAAFVTEDKKRIAFIYFLIGQFVDSITPGNQFWFILDVLPDTVKNLQQQLYKQTVR